MLKTENEHINIDHERVGQIWWSCGHPGWMFPGPDEHHGQPDIGHGFVDTLRWILYPLPHLPYAAERSNVSIREEYPKLMETLSPMNRLLDN